MSEWIEFTGKTVEEAISNASIQLQVPSDELTIEIIERESSGFLGINKKLAKIKVLQKTSVTDTVKEFLSNVFKAMEIEAEVQLQFDEEEKTIDIDIVGDDMGVLIGKRGQTLDSLQYLASLVANKDSEEYIKVKLDTENYRERRKETLENLAKNIAFKVKRTHQSVALEPMNPYERRIIHSALQNDKYVETHSEGEEPFRKVIVSLKKGVDTGYGYNKNRRYGNNSYKKNSNNNRKYGQRRSYSEK